MVQFFPANRKQVVTSGVSEADVHEVLRVVDKCNSSLEKALSFGGDKQAMYQEASNKLNTCHEEIQAALSNKNTSTHTSSVNEQTGSSSLRL